MATPDFIKAPIALINNLFLPHPKAQQVDLSGKVILITGATEGAIGYESAKVLSSWGAEVCVTARTQENAQACLASLKKANPSALISVYVLDLQNDKSVSDFSSWFTQRFDNLDVLLNNAGIYLDVLGQWKEPHLSEDGKEIHWRVNFLGSVQLTCELLPLLRKTAKAKGEARIINVSSHMHDNCQNEEMFSGLTPYKSVKAYGCSKLAINHFTFFLHKKIFVKHNIKVMCLHPGSIYTNLVEKGLAGNPKLLAVRSKLAWIEKLILLSPFEGAQTQVYCASAKDVKSGAYYRRCALAEPSKSLNEAGVSEKLWKESLEWLKSKNLILNSQLD